jgi:hypothetical protein
MSQVNEHALNQMRVAGAALMGQLEAVRQNATDDLKAALAERGLIELRELYHQLETFTITLRQVFK